MFDLCTSHHIFISQLMSNLWLAYTRNLTWQGLAPPLGDFDRIVAWKLASKQALKSKRLDTPEVEARCRRWRRQSQLELGGWEPRSEV